jgi:hypothetical protein
VVLRVLDGSPEAFAYGTVTRSGWLFHTILLAAGLVTPKCRALQPQPGKPDWFGLIPVRSPLLGEWFLFLWVLRCFSSPGSLHRPYVFRSGCRWFAAAGFPIRKSSDHHLYTATRGLSQCPTSFIGVWRQGIHRVPLLTCSRDAEKSNFFSLLLVDALSIQLLRCCLRLPGWAAAGYRSLLSAVPGDLPLTQHSPAHCRAALPSFSVPYPAELLLVSYSQYHQPFVRSTQVEMRGFEPLASALQRQRSPS